MASLLLTHSRFYWTRNVYTYTLQQLRRGVKMTELGTWNAGNFRKSICEINTSRVLLHRGGGGLFGTRRDKIARNGSGERRFCARFRASLAAARRRAALDAARSLVCSSALALRGLRACRVFVPLVDQWVGSERFAENSRVQFECRKRILFFHPPL